MKSKQYFDRKCSIKKIRPGAHEILRARYVCFLLVVQ